MNLAPILFTFRDLWYSPFRERRAANGRNSCRSAERQRITDYISVGVIERTFPLMKVKEVLRRTGRASQRERALPAHIMVYCVIALALYMQSSCREVLRCLPSGRKWLRGSAGIVRVVGKSGISQARSRLGHVPLKVLHDELGKPIATAETKGAWYRGRGQVSLDGSTMDVAYTANNTRRSVGLAPVAARARILSFALYRWLRAGRTCCSGHNWEAITAAR